MSDNEINQERTRCPLHATIPGTDTVTNNQCRKPAGHDGECLFDSPAPKDRFSTDVLGFHLKVYLEIVDDRQFLGRHSTFEDIRGSVSAGAPHTIKLKRGLSDDHLHCVVAHESYHLFFSIRSLITAEEEVQAEAFGELVGRIIHAYRRQ